MSKTAASRRRGAIAKACRAALRLGYADVERGDGISVLEASGAG